MRVDDESYENVSIVRDKINRTQHRCLLYGLDPTNFLYSIRRFFLCHLVPNSCDRSTEVPDQSDNSSCPPYREAFVEHILRSKSGMEFQGRKLATKIYSVLWFTCIWRKWCGENEKRRFFFWESGGDVHVFVSKWMIKSSKYATLLIVRERWWFLNNAYALQPIVWIVALPCIHTYENFITQIW